MSATESPIYRALCRGVVPLRYVNRSRDKEKDSEVPYVGGVSCASNGARSCHTSHA